MEKANKNKSLILKFLPKAASAVNFHNPQPFSPGRDHHHHHHHHHTSTKLKANAHKGFSGLINFAVLPDEAREKPKNGSYDPPEPTSPKVSCMGQIKYKHKKKKLMKAAKNPNTTTTSSSSAHDDHHHVQVLSKSKETKKSVSAVSKFFSMKPSKPERTGKGSQTNKHGKIVMQDNNKIKVSCPSLGQMKKFASGRETLGNFDWTAQIAPVDHDRDYFSDEERKKSHSDDDDEVIIPFSAPIMLGRKGLNLEPRKEINLWKRRTMDPPPPLACIQT